VIFELITELRGVPWLFDNELSAPSLSIKGFDKVILAGVGSSGVCAELFSALLPVPSVVIKKPELPSWADNKTLVVILSNSGDSQQVISLLGKAIKQKCRVLCVTSGDKLLLQCKRNKTRVIIIKKERLSEERTTHMIYFMIEPVLNFFIKNKLLVKHKDLVQSLELVSSVLGSDDNPLFHVTRAIHKRVLIIYSEFPFAAEQLKTQLNEEAGMQAYYNSLPEAGHNELLAASSPVVLIRG